LGKRTKAAVQMVALGHHGLLAWHTIYWHLNGTQKSSSTPWAITGGPPRRVSGTTWPHGSGWNLLGLYGEVHRPGRIQGQQDEHFASEEESEPSDAGQEAASGTAKGEEAKASELVA
jgi:hypothetical protein